MGQKVSIHAYHTSTQEAWRAMLQACENATKSIWLEEFILNPDSVGLTFLDIFERKAKEGLDVRLLLDYWGCKKLARSSWVERLDKAGAHVYFFRPPSLGWIVKSPRFFPRDHRKILILDGEKTFAGGVCIYEDSEDWRDTMLEFSGDLTDQFEHIFNQTWQKVEGDECETEAHPDFETDADFSVYANAPDSGESEFTEELLKQLCLARENIQLVTPYFAPSPELLSCLYEARGRGVKVEILLSNYSKFSPYVVGKLLCGDLLKKGVSIYYYEPVMLHLKMAVIDSRWAAIGSCNLDGLSLHRNQEDMLVSTNEKFVQQLGAHFEHDVSESKSFSLQEWRNRPIPEKIAGYCLRPFRYYL